MIFGIGSALAQIRSQKAQIIYNQRCAIDKRLARKEIDMKNCCRNCKYSDKSASPDTYCYKNPPVPNASGRGKFPMVNRSEWCGQWETCETKGN